MKKNYLIIDTETMGDVSQPLPYDIGYVITDNQGDIKLQRSFVVAEIFCDLKEGMKSAYYAEKIPSYWEDIKNGTRELRTFRTIHKIILRDMRAFKVDTVMAYNMNFDKRALNNLIRYVTKSKFRWFFPFGTNFECIWNMACQTLLNTKSYIDFAEKNNLVSASNNILTSAESCYKFLKNNILFEEEHKGLDDVLIETEIFAKCISTHKKMDRKPNPSCWRLPQRKRKEMELREVLR